MGFFRKNKVIQAEEKETADLLEELLQADGPSEEPFVLDESEAVPTRRKITLDDLKAPEGKMKHERSSLSRMKIEKENLQKHEPKAAERKR